MSGFRKSGHNYGFKKLFTFFTSFIASVPKHEAHFNIKFEIVCITVRSLVISHFSHDFLQI